MPSSNLQNKIYLAGGFRSGWQAGVIKQLPGYIFLDPSQHNIKDPKEYTIWDLEAIRQCDIVLANMEPTNPGGYSLALEIGFGEKGVKQAGFTLQNIGGTYGLVISDDPLDIVNNIIKVPLQYFLLM